MASQKIVKKGGIANEQIVARFQELRQQQRSIVSKISELEQERKEHDLVIETLKEVEGDRRCFRLVGGVLVERTVKEVTPALSGNSAQISRLIETLSAQMESKGKEINEYREKHNIRVRGEDDKAGDQKENQSGGSQGVLVEKDS